MLTASFVRQIKGWYDTDFQYMGEFVNNDGTYQVTKSNIPLSLAGAVWTPDDNYSFQLWDYFAYEYFNGLYLQGNSSWPLTDNGTRAWPFRDGHSAPWARRSGAISTPASGRARSTSAGKPGRSP